MTEKLAVSSEFLQKVVGFAEAANVMMKSAEDQRQVIRKAAEAAVDVLEKAGKLERGQDKAKLVEGFVNRPEMALKLAASLVLEKKEEKSDNDADDKEEKKEEAGEDCSKIGSAGVSESPVKRAAETTVGPKTHGGASQRKESDEVWDRGFGLGRS